jgi:hypothetical protein
VYCIGSERSRFERASRTKRATFPMRLSHRSRICALSFRSRPRAASPRSDRPTQETHHFPPFRSAPISPLAADRAPLPLAGGHPGSRNLALPGAEDEQCCRSDSCERPRAAAPLSSVELLLLLVLLAGTPPSSPPIRERREIPTRVSAPFPFLLPHCRFLLPPATINRPRAAHHRWPNPLYFLHKFQIPRT